MKITGYIGLALLIILLLFALSSQAMMGATSFVGGNVLGSNAEIDTAAKAQEKADKAAQGETVTNEKFMGGRRYVLDKDGVTWVSQPDRMCREDSVATPTACPANATASSDRLPVDGGATATGTATVGMPSSAYSILGQ